MKIFEIEKIEKIQNQSLWCEKTNLIKKLDKIKLDKNQIENNPRGFAQNDLNYKDLLVVKFEWEWFVMVKLGSFKKFKILNGQKI